ncbi:MAG: outer membrane protein assembly factor BamD [Planctomycetota bacterium]|jgi:outer membrane protein assembly factor BamD (BamD/ComL family)
MTAHDNSKYFHIDSRLSAADRALTALLLALAVSVTMTGCQSTGSLADRSGEIDASALKGTDDDRDLRNIDDVIGPLQREALAKAGRGGLTSTEDLNDQETLKEGLRLYESKDYAQADRIFRDLIRKRNPNRISFSLFSRKEKRPTYDPVREEAVFFLAESLYQQEELANSAKQYQALIKDYPSTRYLDESTRRLFDISRRWLGVDDFATSSEIRQVSLEDGADKGPLSTVQAKKRGFLPFPNLTDRSRPAVDLSGNALKNLKTIWMNDPSGPLADDALMLAATHYLRKEDYRNADRLLTMLREQFPKSTHLQTAFVLGSHVKLMSYQGSAYDEQLLTDAKELKENTLRLFPEIAESDRIRNELKLIYDAEARRDWEKALFYDKKNDDRAVAVYCREVIRNYSDTKYADLARKKLASLQPEALAGPATASPAAPADQSIMPFQSQPEALGRAPVFEDGPALRPVPTGSGPNFEDGPVFEPDGPIFDEEQPPGAGAVGRVKVF